METRGVWSNVAIAAVNKREKPVKPEKPEKLSPAFNKLWSASLMSNLADGLLRSAAPLLATRLTQDPLLISGLGALVMLPWLLFAIPVGGLVDRVDRRLALAFANAARFLITGTVALTISLGTLNIWGLYLAAFCLGICEVIYDTTGQSMIPQVLGPKQLERGNARLQISEVVVGEFTGAPIGGLLYAVAIVLPFLFNSLGFLVAMVLVLLVPKSFAQTLKKPMDKVSGLSTETGELVEVERTGFWQDIRFGLNYLWQDKILMRLVVTTAAIGACFALATSTMVLFLLNELQVPSAFFGFVMLTMAIGSILGGIYAPKASTRFGRGTVMAVAIVGMCAFNLSAGFAPNVFVLMAFFFFSGMLNSSWNLLLMSCYHSLIPNHLFGRIHGARRTLVWGMMPIGSVIGGAIAGFGLRLPFFIGGAISTVIALTAFGFVRRLGNEVASAVDNPAG